VSLGCKGNEEQRRGKKKERKEKKEEWCVGWGEKEEEEKKGEVVVQKGEKRESDKVRHVAQCEWPGEDEEILSSQPDDATWQRSIVFYFKPSTYINYCRTH
jgi:hypothetical protein